MKRIQWEIRFDKGRGVWVIWQSRVQYDFWAVKINAVRAAASECKARWDQDGILSELTIKNKNGQIGKGSNGRRTYGKDPRGTKG